MVGGRTLLEKVERRRDWLGILWTVCLELATEPSSSREEKLSLLVHPGPVHPLLGEVTGVHVVLDAFYSRTTPQCWASAPASSFLPPEACHHIAVGHRMTEISETNEFSWMHEGRKKNLFSDYKFRYWNIPPPKVFCFKSSWDELRLIINVMTIVLFWGPGWWWWGGG